MKSNEEIIKYLESLRIEYASKCFELGLKVPTSNNSNIVNLFDTFGNYFKRLNFVDEILSFIKSEN